jgi:hypothetical protein
MQSVARTNAYGFEALGKDPGFFTRPSEKGALGRNTGDNNTADQRQGAFTSGFENTFNRELRAPGSTEKRGAARHRHWARLMAGVSAPGGLE